MRVITWFCLIAIILSTGTASAQVLLSPRAVGSARYQRAHHWQSHSWSQHECLTGLQNKWETCFSSFLTLWTFDVGVIEFNIEFTTGGASFPLPEMTEYNWIAMLTGLQVEGVFQVGNSCCVNLYDLLDNAEDGYVTADDWMKFGTPICGVIDGIPTVGYIVDPVDVTQALRNDLFGPGFEGETSGFYLGGDSYGTVSYNRTTLRLEISFPPTATPTISPTPSPTNTPVASNVRIWMPSNYYRPAQSAACFVYFNNPLEPRNDVPLFVILDAYGQFFFAPDFDDFSYYMVDVSSLEAKINVLNPFPWPEDCGSAEGIRWYAALTDPSMTSITSNLDMFTFGWCE